MSRLNASALATLRDAGVSESVWARANYCVNGKWVGDVCGCPDDRCANGFHHYGVDDCGCLETMLGLFLKGTGGTFADGVLPPVMRPYGGFYRPRKLAAERVDDEDGELTGVLVFGTHRPAAAQALADKLAMREAGSTFRALDPVPGWWRDGFEAGRRRWISDEETGRAAVLFRQIAEVDAATAAEEGK
jgi:hypothetical protein